MRKETGFPCSPCRGSRWYLSNKVPVRSARLLTLAPPTRQFLWCSLEDRGIWLSWKDDDGNSYDGACDESQKHTNNNNSNANDDNNNNSSIKSLCGYRISFISTRGLEQARCSRWSLSCRWKGTRATPI